MSEACHYLNAAFDPYSNYTITDSSYTCCFHKFCTVTLRAPYMAIRVASKDHGRFRNKAEANFRLTPTARRLCHSTWKPCEVVNKPATPKPSISRQTCSRYHKCLYTIAPDSYLDIQQTGQGMEDNKGMRSKNWVICNYRPFRHCQHTMSTIAHMKPYGEQWHSRYSRRPFSLN